MSFSVPTASAIPSPSGSVSSPSPTGPSLAYYAPDNNFASYSPSQVADAGTPSSFDAGITVNSGNYNVYDPQTGAYGAGVTAYDPQTQTPAEAYLTSGVGSGGYYGDTLINYAQQNNIDPLQLAEGFNTFMNANPGDGIWLGPDAALQAASEGLSSSNPALSKQIEGGINQQELAQQQAPIGAYQTAAQQHPEQNYTGMDFLEDVVIPAVTMALPALGGLAGLGDVAAGTASLPAAGVSSGIADMFGGTTGALGTSADVLGTGTTLADGTTAYDYGAANGLGAGNAGAGVMGTTGPTTASTGVSTADAISQAGQSAAKQAIIKKLSGQPSSGFNPTSYVQPISNVASTFADGGSVDDSFDDTDLGGDVSFAPPPQMAMDASSDPALGGSAPPLSSASPYAGSLNMGMVPGDQIIGQGTTLPDGTISYDYAAAQALPPGDAGRSDVGTSSGEAGSGSGASGLTAALTKAGLLDKDGNVNLGAALKAGGSALALLAAYMKTKQLATQGSQLAAAQVQPAQVFTPPQYRLGQLPGCRLLRHQHPPELQGRRAVPRRRGPDASPPRGRGPSVGGPHGRNAPHHVPAGHEPHARRVAARPRWYAPAPRRDGRQPRAADANGRTGSVGQPSPPTQRAVPAPANHFARGGLSTMHTMQHGEHTGAGPVYGAGGGQDDLVPARLSPGEYVFDADTVAQLGDGNSEEGARRLDAWRKHLREHKRGAPSSEIPPKARDPQYYLRGTKT